MTNLMPYWGKFTEEERLLLWQIITIHARQLSLPPNNIHLRDKFVKLRVLVKQHLMFLDKDEAVEVLKAYYDVGLTMHPTDYTTASILKKLGKGVRVKEESRLTSNP